MGAARLLAKGWIVFCLYGGGLALVHGLARQLPLAEAARTVSVCVLLFGAMGLLFISGFGLSSWQAGQPLLKRLKPAHFVPGFNELVFVAFALLVFYVQVVYAPANHTGAAVEAVVSAMRFAVFGQRTFEAALAQCNLDAGRLFVSATSWMLALIFICSALSRIRLAASLIRFERKRRPEAMGAQPLAFALGLAGVVGIQFLYIGTGYAFLPCRTLAGLWGDLAIGLGPLALAYLLTAALTNLLALGPDS
jgi:hypothetical protein